MQVNLAVPPVAAQFSASTSFSVGTSETTTKTESTINTALAQARSYD